MGPQAVKKRCVKKNITGLRNQKCLTATVDENNDLGLGLLFDSTRVDWPTEIELDDDEPDEELADEDYGDEEFTVALVEIAVKSDDPRDADWLPVECRRKQAVNKGQITLLSEDIIIDKF